MLFDTAIINLLNTVMTWAVAPMTLFIMRLYARVLILETQFAERTSQRVEDRIENKKELANLHAAIEKLREAIERMHQKNER